MQLSSHYERHLTGLVDAVFNHLPQPEPKPDRLKACKLIAHRGEYDNCEIFENTLSAFDHVHGCGVWGIEFDVRWTKDLQPIVFHDSHLLRLFGVKDRIQSLNWAEIKSRFPQIPTLVDVVQRYGGRMHLMVELKDEPYPQPEYQNRILKSIFADLKPATDYHLLTLSPHLFELISFVNPKTFIPIAKFNWMRFSRMALKKPFGGISGHYMLLNSKLLKKHQALGQQVGTGFIDTPQVLFREINRGADWLFSNRAVKLQRMLHQIESVSPTR